MTDYLSRSFQEAHILVTGGAGFIGSHLVEELVAQGASVFVIDDLSNSDISNLASVISEIDFIESSILDSSQLTTVFAEHSPEVVFHLAAGNLAKSIANPQKDVQVTLLGLLNILEQMRKSSQDVVLVHSSSGSVYGEPVNPIQAENHHRSPTSPYGVAKMASEEYVRVWHQMYGIPYVVLRYYNVYGPRQSFSETEGGGVIPIFARRILSNQPLHIDGTGEQQRCFTHVSDVVRANLKSIQKESYLLNTYNIASNERIDILSLAHKMMDIAGIKVPLIFEPPRQGEIMVFNPSIDLASEEMGYEPIVSLQDGLRMYFDWLKSHQT